MRPYQRALPFLITPVQYWQGKLMTLSYHALIPTGCLLFITAPISLILALLAFCLASPYSDHLMLLARWVWLPTTVGVFLCLILPLLLIITNRPVTQLGKLICHWSARRNRK